MATTQYIWDELSDNVLMETDELGVATAEYTQEPAQFGELVSQHRDGVTSQYHYDGTGSTRQLTDENENVTDDYTYSAFGEEVASSGTTVNPFGFQGSVGYYVNPETNDVYVRARTYKPSLARWLSPDPLPEQGAEIFYPVPDLQYPAMQAAFTQPYLYVRNNPINVVDPSGLLCCVTGFQVITAGKSKLAQIPNPNELFDIVPGRGQLGPQAGTLTGGRQDGKFIIQLPYDLRIILRADSNVDDCVITRVMEKRFDRVVPNPTQRFFGPKPDGPDPAMVLRRSASSDIFIHDGPGRVFPNPFPHPWYLFSGFYLITVTDRTTAASGEATANVRVLISYKKPGGFTPKANNEARLLKQAVHEHCGC